MSMCLGLCTLSNVNIERVLADPLLIWKVLAPDDPELDEKPRDEQPVGLLSKICGRKKAPTMHEAE